MTVSIVSPTPLILPAGYSVRKPTRPWSGVDADYLEKFDWTTLAFDITAESERFELVCPPLQNFKRALRDVLIANEIDISSRIRTHKLDRCEVLRFEAFDRMTSARRFHNPLQTNQLLAGQNVLMTLSKDNDLGWIRDWIEFHAKVHGVSAVLLYDNNSTRYDPSEIGHAAASTNGVEEVVVVKWPFKYGPQGSGGRGWDSDFCQAGALNHARVNFLRRAQSVLSVDIDELVVGRGRDSILQSLLSSTYAAYSFSGRWVSAELRDEGTIQGDTELPSSRTIRHRDFQMLESSDTKCPPKWAAVPSRLRAKSYFTTHGVRNCTSTNAEQFEYRHFKAINTGWKYNRFRSQETRSPLTIEPCLRDHIKLVWPN